MRFRSLGAQLRQILAAVINSCLVNSASITHLWLSDASASNRAHTIIERSAKLSARINKLPFHKNIPAVSERDHKSITHSDHLSLNTGRAIPPLLAFLCQSLCVAFRVPETLAVSLPAQPSALAPQMRRLSTRLSAAQCQPEVASAPPWQKDRTGNPTPVLGAIKTTPPII
jgi:hypothetical protein